MMKRAPPKYLFMSEKLLCPPMVGLGGISSVSGKWKNFISLHIESIDEKGKKSRKEKEAGRREPEWKLHETSRKDVYKNMRLGCPTVSCKGGVKI